VKAYEDGDYKTATAQIQTALDHGLASAADRARAHKYQAFIVCVNGREKACRDEFRMALEADPDFALAPAEATHPVWSRVLRSVRNDLARAKAAKPAATATKPAAGAAKPAAAATGATPGTGTPPKPAANAPKPAASPKSAPDPAKAAGDGKAATGAQKPAAN
jgi:hypothetical protein